jgi:hypothetical protein
MWYGDGVAVTTAVNHQKDVRIVTDGNHGAVIGWVDQRDDATNDKDIYVGGVNQTGAIKVPTLLKAYSTDVDVNSVSIRWTLSESGEKPHFYVLRAEGSLGDFRDLTDAEIVGDGLTYAVTDITCAGGKSYRYRVDVSDEDGHRVLFETNSITVPVTAANLEQNTPNPFNPSTVIRFSLPADARVNLSVFDVRGSRVATVLDGLRPSGANEVEWNGTDDSGAPVSSGVYFYRLTVGKRVLTKKMVVTK